MVSIDDATVAVLRQHNQRRGVVHFHAVIRLDGPAGPTTAPPGWATLDLLTAAIAQAARTVHIETPVVPGLPARTQPLGTFHGVAGEPIYPDTVTSLMTKLIRAHNSPERAPRPKVQLPHTRLHDLRHLHATTLLLSGVPVHVGAARLGHADPAITLRVYALR